MGVLALFTVLAVFSMFCACYVAYTIFYNAKLSIHPSKLIGYMCLCEGIASYNALIWAANPEVVICYFGLHYLFSWTLFGQVDYLKALQVLCKSNQVVVTFFQFLSLAFNFCLCLDLISTLRNPFYPHKRKMKWYILGSVLVVAFMTFFSRGTLEDQCKVVGLPDDESNFQDTQEFKAVQSLISAVALTIYILMALFSCVYAFRKLTKPGMSEELRSLYIRKHILYVGAFIVIWTFYLAASYYQMYLTSLNFSDEGLNQSEQQVLKVLNQISIIVAMTTGFIMALIRSREPYFKFLIRQQFWEFFGVVLSEKELNDSEVYINDTLATFLTSSLNVELVHVILISIMNSSGKVKDGYNYLSYNVKDFRATHKYMIDSIKIRDPESWQVAKLSDFIINEYDLHRKTTKSSNYRATKTTNNQLLDDINQDFEDDRLIINEDISITEYAPDVFAFLRSLDGIGVDCIRESLSTEKNREMVFKAGESQGKSGSFFFFSHDKKFIIKTMTNSDFKAFKNLFPQYLKAVGSRPNSLLARIYGVYTIKKEDLEPVSLILMGNSKQAQNKLIEHVFDLKGSYIHREVKGKKFKNTATLKDVNLLNFCKEQILLRFRTEDREMILEQLERDVEILLNNNLMDYSILFAVERNPLSSGGSSTEISEQELEKMRLEFDGNRHKFLSIDGKYIYHVGIIDYLQDFNLEKQFESKLKLFINKSGAQISAIDPKPYATRYLKFMRDKVFIDQKASKDDEDNTRILKKFKTKRF